MRPTTSRDYYPCADYPDGKCPNREPGCQSKCLKMLAAQLVADQRKRVERANKAHDIDVQGVDVNRYNRQNRKRSRQI